MKLKGGGAVHIVTNLLIFSGLNISILLLDLDVSIKVLPVLSSVMTYSITHNPRCCSVGKNKNRLLSGLQFVTTVISICIFIFLMKI